MVDSSGAARPEISRHLRGSLGILCAAAFIAVCIAVVFREEAGVFFLDLNVQSERATVIQVFCDDGAGFRQKESSGRRLAGGEAYTLRFALPGAGVKAVRIDFERPATAISINSIKLISLLDGAEVPIDLEALSPLRDIETYDVADHRLRVTAAGPDPQLVVSLSSIRLATERLSPGLIVASTFLLYPLLWLLVRRIGTVCRSRAGTGEGGPEAGKWSRAFPAAQGFGHHLLLALGAVFWAAAACSVLVELRSGFSIPAPEGSRTPQFYAQAFRDRTIELEREDGIRISATVFRPEQESGPFPALLLLHGNYPQGQGYPLYRVLAQELADRGYVVMTMDFAGYGNSEDPFAGTRPRDVSFEPETRAAIAYLDSLPGVRSGHLGIIGHSMGADPALRVGVGEAPVSTIVLIGPPRRVQERFHSPADVGFFWNWAHEVGRRQYGRDRFPAWYDKNRWLNGILARDMLYLLPSLTRFRHKPVLFIDGEREPGPDRRFLADYAARCSFPKGYVTLSKADHDANVGSRANRIVYEPVAMAQLVAAIDAWCSKTMQGRPGPQDYGRNLLRWFFGAVRFTAGR